jgi:hypothetical protein
MAPATPPGNERTESPGIRYRRQTQRISKVHCPAYAQALSSLVHRSGITPPMEYGSTGLATTIEMVASQLGLAIAAGSPAKPDRPHQAQPPRRLTNAGR